MSDKINAQQEEELRANFNTLGEVFAAANMAKPGGMQWKKIPPAVYTAAMNSLGEDEEDVPQSPVDSPYAHTVQELQALNQEVQSYPNDGGDDNYAVYGLNPDGNGDLDAQWEYLMSVKQTQESAMTQQGYTRGMNGVWSRQPLNDGSMFQQNAPSQAPQVATATPNFPPPVMKAFKARGSEGQIALIKRIAVAAGQGVNMGEVTNLQKRFDMYTRLHGDWDRLQGASKFQAPMMFDVDGGQHQSNPLSDLEQMGLNQPFINQQQDQTEINIPATTDPDSTDIIGLNAMYDTKTRFIFAAMTAGIMAQSKQNAPPAQREANKSFVDELLKEAGPTVQLDRCSRQFFLLATARNRPGFGGVVGTRINRGDGPKTAQSEIIYGTQPGFTTYIVAQWNTTNNRVNIPDITQYGIYPMLAEQLVPKDQRGEIVWGNVNARLVTQQNFPRAGNFDRYIIQLPVSKEIQQADPRNNTRAESRMNLLFYMNPSEIERLLNDGLGHQLEYYCDYFQTKLSDRYAVHFEHLQNEADNKYANELLQEAAKRREALSPQAARSQAEGKGSIGIFPRMKAMMKVMTEGFTGIESFTGDLSVRNGKPDSIYLYMCWKFYVLQIQDLTNQLTIINTKIENKGGITAARDGRRGGLALAQENLYRKLINIIFEMDVWNYFIQTPPAAEQGGRQESPEDIGYWNFSALGISRTGPTMNELASYKYDTKTMIEYPRFMYQTFHQLFKVENDGLTEKEQARALGAAISRYNQKGTSALESIRFGNTMSIWEYAQTNAAEIAKMSPQQHFQILSQTMARRALTVQQAMDDTKRSQSNLERYVLQASRMTSEEFEQLTGQKKSANVAFAEISRVRAGWGKKPAAFSLNDSVNLPEMEIQRNLKTIMERSTILLPYTSAVAVNRGNPTVKIIEVYTPGTINNNPYYLYKVRYDGGGSTDSPIKDVWAEEELLKNNENVELANNNLVKKVLTLQNDQGGRTRVAQSGMNAKIAIEILTGNQQAVPFKQTDIDLDIDVKYTSEKMIFADLQELVVINQSTGEFQPTSQALKGDGVILAMALGRREEERKQLEIFKLLQEKAQSWALEGQHGTGEGSDHESIQEYHFQRFKLYEKKWFALQKAWNLVYNIMDDETRTAMKPAVGIRAPLAGWGEQEVSIYRQNPLSLPISVTQPGLCLNMFDKFSKFFSPDSMVYRTLTNVRDSFFRKEQTFAQTWNNGKIKKWLEWAQTDSELSQILVQADQGSRTRTRITLYNQEWYDNRIKHEATMKQIQKEVAVAAVIRLQAEREQARIDAEEARQQARQQARNAQQNPGGENQGGGRRMKGGDPLETIAANIEGKTKDMAWKEILTFSNTEHKKICSEFGVECDDITIPTDQPTETGTEEGDDESEKEEEGEGGDTPIVEEGGDTPIVPTGTEEGGDEPAEEEDNKIKVTQSIGDCNKVVIPAKTSYYVTPNGITTDLPEGVSSVPSYSGDDGKTYYWNTKTQNTTYDQNDGTCKKDQPQEEKNESQIIGDWETNATGDCKKMTIPANTSYWINPEDGSMSLKAIEGVEDSKSEQETIYFYNPKTSKSTYTETDGTCDTDEQKKCKKGIADAETIWDTLNTDEDITKKGEELKENCYGITDQITKIEEKVKQLIEARRLKADEEKKIQEKKLQEESCNTRTDEFVKDMRKDRTQEELAKLDDSVFSEGEAIKTDCESNMQIKLRISNAANVLRKLIKKAKEDIEKAEEERKIKEAKEEEDRQKLENEAKEEEERKIKEEEDRKKREEEARKAAAKKAKEEEEARKAATKKAKEEEKKYRKECSEQYDEWKITTDEATSVKALKLPSGNLESEDDRESRNAIFLRSSLELTEGDAWDNDWMDNLMATAVQLSEPPCGTITHSKAKSTIQELVRKQIEKLKSEQKKRKGKKKKAEKKKREKEEKRNKKENASAKKAEDGAKKQACIDAFDVWKAKWSAIDPMEINFDNPEDDFFTESNKILKEMKCGDIKHSVFKTIKAKIRDYIKQKKRDKQAKERGDATKSEQGAAKLLKKECRQKYKAWKDSGKWTETMNSLTGPDDIIAGEYNKLPSDMKSLAADDEYEILAQYKCGKIKDKDGSGGKPISKRVDMHIKEIQRDIKNLQAKNKKNNKSNKNTERKNEGPTRNEPQKKVKKGLSLSPAERKHLKTTKDFYRRSKGKKQAGLEFHERSLKAKNSLTSNSKEFFKTLRDGQMCGDEAYMFGACDPTEMERANSQKEAANNKAMGECKKFVREAYKTHQGQQVCRSRSRSRRRGGKRRKTLKKHRRKKGKKKSKSLKKRK